MQKKKKKSWDNIAVIFLILPRLEAKNIKSFSQIRGHEDWGGLRMNVTAHHELVTQNSEVFFWRKTKINEPNSLGLCVPYKHMYRTEYIFGRRGGN